MSMSILDLMKTPSKYVILPSEGKFYEAGVLEVGITEIAVSSMSAKDELMFKNPDSLMNGEAVINAIRNCARGVLKPEKLNNIDIEAILLGIKSASGDVEIDYNVECPECSKKGSLSVNVDQVLERISRMDDEYSHVLDNGIIVNIRPASWKNHIALMNDVFKQQTLLKVTEEDINEETQKQVISEIYEIITAMKYNNLLFHTLSLTLGDENITDPKVISEFLDLLQTKDIESIESIIKSFNDSGVNNKHVAICSDCKHEWDQDIARFDPSSFFSEASEALDSTKDIK